MLERGVLASKVDQALGCRDVRVQSSELAWREDRRLTIRIKVAHPALGLPHTRKEFLDLLTVDLGEPLERETVTILVWHRVPPGRVVGPGVACEEHAATACAIGQMARVIDKAVGIVGDRATTNRVVSAILRAEAISPLCFVPFPETLAELEEDLGGGVVVQFNDGATFLVGEVWRHSNKAQR